MPASPDAASGPTSLINSGRRAGSALVNFFAEDENQLGPLALSVRHRLILLQDRRSRLYAAHGVLPGLVSKKPEATIRRGFARASVGFGGRHLWEAAAGFSLSANVAFERNVKKLAKPADPDSTEISKSDARSYQFAWFFDQHVTCPDCLFGSLSEALEPRSTNTAATPTSIAFVHCDVPFRRRFALRS